MTNKQSYRIDRLQHLFQVEISTIIQKQIKDPRVKMLSITRVIISRDLSVAKVYFSTFNKTAAEETLVGLKKASGFIHRLLLKRLILKKIPELRFYVDESIKYARYMEDKMKEISKETSND